MQRSVLTSLTMYEYMYLDWLSLFALSLMLLLLELGIMIGKTNQGKRKYEGISTYTKIS